MKRRALVRHLEQHGCELLREGANHSIYVNRVTRKSIPPDHDVPNRVGQVLGQLIDPQVLKVAPTPALLAFAQRHRQVNSPYLTNEQFQLA